MLVSVVICSYNRAAYIGAALDSLYKQTASKEIFEVIVVDNNSTDGTDQVFINFITLQRRIKGLLLQETRALN
jgi:glycosyltransferase involved in cell wall biosynthesis